MDFIKLFKDPIFVSISKMGGHVFHTKDIEKVLLRNDEEYKEGAYFTVNGFANFEEGTYRGRTKNNVTSFNCNFLDIDLTPETRITQAELIYKGLCHAGLTPTAVIITGKGLHVYWLYKNPIAYSETFLKQYEILQTAIVEQFKSEGADRQARDAARVLRIPGARYWDSQGKYKCNVDILYLNESIKYDYIDIAKFFKNSIQIDSKEGESLMRGVDDFDMRTIFSVKHGNMHGMLFSTALSLIQRTKTLTDARKMFEAVLSTWEQPVDMIKSWTQFDNAIKFLEKDRPHLFDESSPSGSLTITPFEEIADEKLEWLWDGFIAKGKAHTFAGLPGLGKSQVTLDIAARLSNGTAFPSKTIGEKEREPMGVIILSAEDGAGDTIKPRLKALGANLKNIFSLSSSKFSRDKTGKVTRAPLALRDDAERILEAIKTLPIKIGLIVIDPVSAFLAKDQDANSNSDVRATLAQLQSILLDKGIALLMINHTNKNTQAKSAHMRSMGSTAWTAVARGTFYAFRDNQVEGRMVFIADKMNLTENDKKGFFYTIKSKDIDVLDTKQKTPYIEWDFKDFPTKTADEYTSDEGKVKEEKTDECKEQLELYMLSKKEVHSKEAVMYMKERGFPQMRVYKAARDLGIIGENNIWKTN